MATKERWAALFESVVGRKPTPKEYMEGKRSDFSPKDIRRIAGLDATSVSKEKDQAQAAAFQDVAEADFEDLMAFQDPSPRILSKQEKEQQDAWIQAFRKYIEREPSPQDFLKGKAANFDLTSINQFLKDKPKRLTKGRQRLRRIGISALALVIIGLVSAIIYGSQYYSREAVADRYLQVAGKNFDQQLSYEVWSDTKKSIKAKDLPYTDTDHVSTTTDKAVLLDGNSMVQAGREFLIFPKWKVAIDPINVKLQTNTKDLSITINSIDYDQSKSDQYESIVKRLYPGTYNFVAQGKVKSQDIEVSSQETITADETIALDIKYLTFKISSNVSDADVYVGAKKVGQLSNGQYSAKDLAVTQSADVYIKKDFQDGTSIKSKTVKIDTIKDNDTLAMDVDGLLSRDKADSLITEAYNLMDIYADNDNTTPDDLDSIFQGGVDNGMYKDLKVMIDDNTINAQNRSADYIDFENVDVTSVTQTSADSYVVNFDVQVDFGYNYSSQHPSSGEIREKHAWSAKVSYDDSLLSDDEYAYDYSDFAGFIIRDKGGPSNRISSENTVE